MKENLTTVTKQKVTAKEVAELAGVSKWTVSRAFTKGASISETSLKRVLEAADTLGYKPNLLARSLTKKKTNMIGVLVAELDTPNVLAVFDELSSQLQMKGLISLVLNVNTATDYNNALSLVDQFQVDGIIFLGTELPQEIIEKNVQHIPLISLYRNSDIPSVQAVSTDGYSAGRDVGSLFVSLGYKRIAYMAGPSKKSTGLMRCDGMVSMLHEHGLKLEDRYEMKHFSRKVAYEFMNNYLASTKPEDRVEAIFCESDILAIGVIDALRYNNVDRSIAVVGFDDIDLAGSPSYNLTTCRQQLKPLVRESIKRLKPNQNQPKTLLMPSEFILRHSHLRIPLNKK
ncbi:LacI family DNA-binding transcriptional regulator [Vibrio viridaestus]|uniref:LacI family transcriptional regulator n=1 Tax=Vibrio viridaestus TaxID=2487322 RepID=A0A3N9TG38_9VIBR|nr:LacI family DNA-binding transcriptional regulator [Vibrio viridaestus]RQW62713.1 LacI family transcriptional regulator [Vibrio viridaestus]